MKHLLNKWDEWIRDYEANVTHIYGRALFHRLFDVVSHSVLSFRFKGQILKRGWIEALIAGETRTGKSEVAKGLSAHFQIQKPYELEQVSLAGLIGGIQQTSGGRFILTWGHAPRMDRRMMTWDELTGLSTEMISSLSGMRSSGVVSIMKISGGETLARIRKLMLSNMRTRNNRNVPLNSLPYGIMIIPPIVGRAEDIARYDLVTVAGRDEVDYETVINVKHRKAVKHQYTSDAAHASVMFAWTRKPEQVLWMKGVEDMVLDLANAQCKKYTDEIPVVEPGEQRFRIARVAVALATRFYSTDSSGENVVVKKEHVELADWLFKECYDRPACAYDKFSAKHAQLPMTEEQYKNIKHLFESMRQGKAVAESLIYSENIEQMPLVDYTMRSKVLAEMLNLGLIKQTGGSIQKTIRFLDFHTRWEKELKDVNKKTG